MTSRLRLALLAVLALTVLAALAARMVDMQWRHGSEYAAAARRSSVVIEPVPAPRGRLLDRRGRLLVSNEPCFQLTVFPAEMRDRKLTARRLAEALQVKPEHLSARLQKALQQAPLEKLVLRRSLTPGQISRLLLVTPELPGTAVEVGARRRYLAGRLAAHVLGTMGEIDAHELPTRRKLGYAAGDPMGRSGIERQYDFLLRGKKGQRHLAVDVLGRTVRVLEVVDPVPGADLHLTLDRKIQETAQRALAQTLAELRVLNQEDSSGAVVVMEASTGRIRALVSLPDFDPALFARGIKPRDLDALYGDPRHPLLSRAYQSSFSPGSTFKLITASAALQEKLCTSGSVFVCGGSYMGASCFVTSGHGGIGFVDSLAHSCDVVYYRLGDQLGIDRLSRYCAAFSLGKPTGLDVPAETGGLLPTAAWKERELGEEWYPGDTVNMSIGQGFLLVSPLQMAVATAAVANGGQVPRPYLVEKAVGPNGRILQQNRPRLRKLPVSKHHLAAVRQGMRGAVQYGTGMAADAPQVAVAGKTGTVESFANVNNPHGRNHVWFVSYAPADKPELVVVVFLEKSGGYGGSLAAPIARKVYDFVYPP